jgi:hypothetical protein
VFMDSIIFISCCFQAMSPSDHEDENDPDGIYAFRRKKGCSYLAVSWHSMQYSEIYFTKNCLAISWGRFRGNGCRTFTGLQIVITCPITVDHTSFWNRWDGEYRNDNYIFGALSLVVATSFGCP